MKAITFLQACHLLNESSAVCIDGELTRAYITDSSVEFFWESDGGRERSFVLDDSASIVFDGCTIHTDEYAITLLVLMKKDLDTW